MDNLNPTEGLAGQFRFQRFSDHYVEKIEQLEEDAFRMANKPIASSTPESSMFDLLSMLGHAKHLRLGRDGVLTVSQHLPDTPQDDKRQWIEARLDHNMEVLSEDIGKRFECLAMGFTMFEATDEQAVQKIASEALRKSMAEEMQEDAEEIKKTFSAIEADTKRPPGSDPQSLKGLLRRARRRFLLTRNLGDWMFWQKHSTETENIRTRLNRALEFAKSNISTLAAGTTESNTGNAISTRIRETAQSLIAELDQLERDADRPLTKLYDVVQAQYIPVAFLLASVTITDVLERLYTGATNPIFPLSFLSLSAGAVVWAAINVLRHRPNSGSA